MVICGIDPGQSKLGISFINIKDDKFTLAHAEVVYHPNDNKLKFNQYLNEGIYNLCDKFPKILYSNLPSIIVAEIVPVGRLGSSTELNVAAITVCKTIAWQWGIDWFDVGANTVKKVITGDGRASKAKIKHEIIVRYPSLVTMNDLYKKEQKTLGNKSTGFPQDLYDAVAIGTTGATMYREGTLVPSFIEEEDQEIILEDE